MERDLQQRLRELTESFVVDVMDAVRAATLDDVFGTMAGFLPTTKSKASADLPARIEALLREHPEGLRAEPIRAELRVEKSAFVRAIDSMLAARKVRKRGERRATKYFVSGAKSTKNVGPVGLAIAKWNMSERQSEVLEHLAQGKANQAIAKALGCGVKTVEQHVGAILKKAHVKSRAELVARVWQLK